MTESVKPKSSPYSDLVVASGPPVVNLGKNKIWVKDIPNTNKFFMLLFCLLFIGVDTVILITTRFGLLIFWAEMLLIFALFGLFFYLENYMYSVKFSKNASSLDAWIWAVVVLRNIVLFLNVIPLIQIIGAFMTVVGIIPYLIAYSVLIKVRYTTTH